MQVRQRSPETRVIILSMHSDESYVLEALPNGAAAYVLKESSADDLTWAVPEVLQGRRYFSPPLSQLAIESYAANAQGVSVDVYKALTTREREVCYTWQPKDEEAPRSQIFCGLAHALLKATVAA